MITCRFGCRFSDLLYLPRRLHQTRHMTPSYPSIGMLHKVGDSTYPSLLVYSGLYDAMPVQLIIIGHSAAG
jgi:hypothetical protein